MNDESGEVPSRPIENQKSKTENRPASDLTIAIMAGGKSRRMGRDKAMIPVGGVPMLERVARAALGTGLRVIVVGRERPPDWPLDAVSFYPDRYPDTGPLGGLATALQVSGTAVLLLACDMPLLTTEAIGWLIEQSAGVPEEDGVVPSNEGRLEPLFAVYRLFPRIYPQDLLDRGEYSIKVLIAGGGFREVDLPEWVRGEVKNVNDIEDLESIGITR